MMRERPETPYWRTPAEVAEALGLPLLGALAAEPRFRQLTDSLAGIAPDPRFSSRVYRFVEGEAPLIRIVGLGDAGEELPVAVGLSEMAAAAGSAPVLLVHTRELVAPPGDLGPGGRPIFSHRFSDALGALFRTGCVARGAGVQGVYRAWPADAGEGPPLEPATVVVAGPLQDDVPELPASAVSHAILVVPYRDQPLEKIRYAVESLKGAGLNLIGCVAYGSEGPAEPQAGEARAEPPSQAEAIEGPPAESAPEPEPIPIARPWSEAFGPRPGAGPRGLRGGSSSRRRWVLPALVAGAAVAAFVAVTLLRMESGRRTLVPPPAAPAAALPRTPSTPVALDSAAAAVAAPPADSGRVAAVPADSAVATETAASARVTAAAPRDSGGPAPAVAPPALARVAARADAPRPAEPGETIRDMVDDRRGPFAVLCGSFLEAARAERLVARLSARGWEARIVRLRIPARGVYRRVVVGSYADVDSARAAARRLADRDRVKDVQVVGAAGLGRTLDAPVGRARR
jgi:cell division septation protein DedD